MKTDLMAVLNDPWPVIFGDEDEYRFMRIGRSQRPCRDGVYVKCQQPDVMTSLRRICEEFSVPFKQRNACQMVIKDPNRLLNCLNKLAAAEVKLLLGVLVAS